MTRHTYVGNQRIASLILGMTITDNALPSFFVEGDDFATGCLVQPDLNPGAERD